MIRHCVFVRFKVSVSATERASILYEMHSLIDVVEGLERADFGSNASSEDLGKGLDHGFIMDFVGAKARDACLAHPLYRAALARLVSACEDGVNGIFVFDLEID